MRPFFFALVTMGLVTSAFAQGHRQHPSEDMPLHEKFYSTWLMPDNPSRSCCNKADCYPTEAKIVGGHRRWHGQGNCGPCGGVP
jgi:hypothetical protein